jgi:acetoacetyl-CoA synthetase
MPPDAAAEGELLWTPGTDFVQRTELMRFMRWLAQTRQLQFEDYEQLRRWSVSDLEGFWRSIWDYFQIIGDGAFACALSAQPMPYTRWFEGTRVNFAEHALRHEAAVEPSRTAIYHSSEVRPLASMSWSELGAQVRRVATSLRELGVEPGDRVVAFMPNIPETAIAMLATVAMGGVWATASMDFGSKTVLDRFKQLGPKLIFIADGYSFGGKHFDKRGEAAAIVAPLASVETVVWLSYTGGQLDEAAFAPKVIAFDALLAGPQISRHEFQYERVPSDHPLWILFSSGTTGLPKAIVHSHVGILVEQLKVKAFHCDMTAADCAFYYSSVGWMMWNSTIASLLTGCTIVLYDGSPTYRTAECLLELVQETHCTMLGISPSYVQMLIKNGSHPKTSFNLSRLRTVMLGGAPASAEVFKWIYRNVGSDLWVVSQSGGTELCSAIVAGAPMLPVYAGEIQARTLGMAAEAWDDAGNSVVGVVGELVVTKPAPSMPIYFVNDPGAVRYRESYFESYPGIWRHGDFIRINARGGCFIYGRSDATLNRFGVRIGTAEIYSIVESIAAIADSLVVCLEEEPGKFFMPLFVRLSDNQSLTEDLIAEIQRRLRTHGSPRHVPDAIYQVPAIPYTLTGKKLEVPVRKILLGAKVADAVSRDSTANPDSLDWYVQFGSDRRSYRRDAPAGGS